MGFTIISLLYSHIYCSLFYKDVIDLIKKAIIITIILKKCYSTVIIISETARYLINTLSYKTIRPYIKLTIITNALMKEREREREKEQQEV